MCKYLFYFYSLRRPLLPWVQLSTVCVY